MGEELGQTKANLNRCLRRRQADRAIGLDDEGAISQKKNSGERRRKKSAEFRVKIEWVSLTTVRIIY